MRIQVLTDKLMVGPAAAVKTGFGDQFSERARTTILRRHQNTTVYLHNASSSHWSREPLAPFDAILPR